MSKKETYVAFFQWIRVLKIHMTYTSNGRKMEMRQVKNSSNSPRKGFPGKIDRFLFHPITFNRFPGSRPAQC